MDVLAKTPHITHNLPTKLLIFFHLLLCEIYEKTSESLVQIINFEINA